MLKMMLSDYRMDLKRVIGETKTVDWSVRLLMMEYFCFMIVVWSDGKALGKGEQEVWSVILYVVIVLCLGVGSFHTNRLGKMFYLLPVSEQDRKNYLLTGYWFRIFLDMLAVGICAAAGVIFVGVPLLQAALILENYFMLMCIVHAYSDVPWESEGEKSVQWHYRLTYAELMLFQRWDNRRGLRWRYYLSWLVALVGMILIIVAVPGRFWHWAYALGVVCQAALTLALCILYWKDDKGRER